MAPAWVFASSTPKAVDEAEHLRVVFEGEAFRDGAERGVDAGTVAPAGQHADAEGVIGHDATGDLNTNNEAWGSGPRNDPRDLLN